MDFIYDYKVPGNYKDQDKIDAYLQKKREEFLENKAPFDALAAEIVMVSLVAQDEPGKTPHHFILNSAVDGCATDEVEGPSTFSFFQEEKDLLVAVLDLLRAGAMTKVTSHNLHKFVLPMLLRRAWRANIINGVSFITPDGRYYDQWKFFDTMNAWSLGITGDEFVSLEKLANHLRIFALSGETPKAMTEPETTLDRLKSNFAETVEDIEEMLKIQLLVAERIGF